jgi:hypothetical protein
MLYYLGMDGELAHRAVTKEKIPLGEVESLYSVQVQYASNEMHDVAFPGPS